MTIPQSFLEGDTLANEMLPAIAKAEKKTPVILEFWAGLLGRQLGYMASSIGRENSLQLLNLMHKQIETATLETEHGQVRHGKPSLSLVKSTCPAPDDQT